MKKLKKTMIWIGISLFSVILISNLIGYIISAPTYQGPVTYHFNGSTFTNPEGVKAKGFKDLIKWMFNREKKEWTFVEGNNNSPLIPGKGKKGEVLVTFVNHSTFLIQFDGLNILTDPIWSKRTSPVQFSGPKRYAKPGIEFEDLPPIDVVIISHNHYDHLDVNTIKMLEEKFSPQFYVPLGVSGFLNKLGVSKSVDMDWWDKLDMNASHQIHCVPAQHFSGRGSFDRDKTLWAGFVFKSEVASIYFAGDSGYGDFFEEIGERLGPFDLSFIPIGAYKPSWFMSPIHISPAEAVKVHQVVHSQQSIAMHFGTFPLADDSMDDPVNDLNNALEEFGIEREKFKVLQNGGQFTCYPIN